MIPAGYMLKNIVANPDWIKADAVADIYSVSNCISRNFADYINFWKHNGYWLFDSPDILYGLAQSEKIDISQSQLFYYELYEYEYHERTKRWQLFSQKQSFITNVQVPKMKKLEGFDVVNFYAGTAPECSPLSCCAIAHEIPTNIHCLLESFEATKHLIENGRFDHSEPGPYRIFAVYTLADT